MSRFRSVKTIALGRLLLLAAGWGWSEAVVWLCRRGAPLEARSDEGRTPLILAARRGELPLIEALLGLGADSRAATDTGITALMTAAREGHTQVVRRLLPVSDSGAINDFGYTALGWATKYGRTDTVRLLLEAGADLGGSDILGLTPVEWAARRGDLALLGLLLAAGLADAERDGDNATWPAWMTELVLEERVDVLEPLGRRQDLRRTGPMGITPLLLAAHHGKTAVARLLLDMGHSPDQADEAGVTPARAAALAGHHHLAQLLTTAPRGDGRTDAVKLADKVTAETASARH